MDGSPTPPSPATKRSTKRTKPDRYREQILAGLDAGMSQRQLGRKYGMSHATISQWLDTIDQEKQQLTRYRTSRADVLSSIQSKSFALQAKIIDQLADDGLLATLSASQKGSLLHSLVVTSGTAYDKERLETGQSTQNISTLSRLIDQSVTTAHQRHRRTPQHIDSRPVHNPDSSDDVNDIK